MTDTTVVMRAAGTDVPVADAVLTEGGGVDLVHVAHVSSLVGELARRDVSGMSQEAFLGAYDAVARLGRLADTLRSIFAGDLARRSTPDQPGGGLARRQGFGNAGTMVAHVTGGTKSGAFRAIEAGRAFLPEPGALALLSEQPGAVSQMSRVDQPDQLGTLDRAPRYPAVAEAAFAGDLSVDAAGLITSGLEAIADRVAGDQLHALERRLVDKAVHLGAHEVRRLVASAVACADVPGHEARENRHHEERYLAWTEDHQGVVTFTGKLDAVTAAPIRTVIEQIVTHDFRARRDQDPAEQDQRTVGQMRADALSQICRHALGCKDTDRSGIRTTIVVRINQRDLESGIGLGSIDGTTAPVSVGQLRRLAGDAAIIPMVLGGESEVLDLGRKVRMFTGAQRLALLERDGGCATCHAPPEHCEAHHIHWWEHGGGTDLSNGVMLCTRCHHDIHRQGWDILVHAGVVEFIPPPHIDPTRTPRPGGRAAIILDKTDDLDNTDDGDNTACATSAEPARRDSGESSAQNHSAVDATGHEPGWDNAA